MSTSYHLSGDQHSRVPLIKPGFNSWGVICVGMNELSKYVPKVTGEIALDYLFLECCICHGLHICTPDCTYGGICREFPRQRVCFTCNAQTEAIAPKSWFTPVAKRPRIACRSF
jgi:hypothetical protein